MAKDRRSEIRSLDPKFRMHGGPALQKNACLWETPAIRCTSAMTILIPFDLNVCCLALQRNFYRFVEKAVARMFLNSVARIHGTSRGPAEMDLVRPSTPQRGSVKVCAKSCSVGVLGGPLCNPLASA